MSFELAMPRKMINHNYADRLISEWSSIHFPQDPEFYNVDGVSRRGRIHIGFHREDRPEDIVEQEPFAILETDDIKDDGAEDETENQKRKKNGLYNVSRMDIIDVGDFLSQMHISPRLDYYITPNSVKGVRRRNSEIFAFHNIVIDIDCHDIGRNPAELAQALEWYLKRDQWFVEDSDVPCPNSIVRTGRGLQLWWAITPLTVTQTWKYLKIGSWLMDRIQDILDEYERELEGIDIDRGASKRLAGWFRLPLTYNTKAHRKGSLEILRTERYEHHALYKMIPKGYRSQDERNQKVKIRNTDSEKPAFLANDTKVFRGGRSGMALRVAQLCDLRSRRQKAGVTDERRDRFCIIVYSALLAEYGRDEAWDRLMTFNSQFLNPLAPATLEKTMSTAREIGGYLYSNNTVITELGITEEEQAAIGLYPTGAIKPKRKKNYTRDLLRQLAKNDRNERILSLWLDGTTKSDIARELKISRNTVAKVIKDFEDQIEEQANEDFEMIQDMQQAEMQAAAGAENVTGQNNDRGEDCSKTVPYNYAFYAPRRGQHQDERQCRVYRTREDPPEDSS